MPDRSLDLLDSAAAHSGTVAVVDLSCLANINNKWGHRFGDEILSAVALRLGPVLAARGGRWLVSVPGDNSPRAAAIAILERLTSDPFVTVPQLDDGGVEPWPLLTATSATNPGAPLRLTFKIAVGAGSHVAAIWPRLSRLPPKWYDCAPEGSCDVCAQSGRYTGALSDRDGTVHAMACCTCGHRWTQLPADPHPAPT